MTRYCLGTAKMNTKPRLLAYMVLALAITGCSCFENWDNTEERYYAPDINATNPTPDEIASKQNIPTANNDFVNYTEVAADYKENGERTPRDQLVVQGGAGSNVSSSIPPTIEEEVTDYEEEISISEGNQNQSGEESSVEDPVEDWLAEEGKTLKELLTEWSDKAGWRLIWNSNRNYTLTAGAMFRGRFADVSSALIRAFARARPAPIATFYKGNRVLVVETLEDENAYD